MRTRARAVEDVGWCSGYTDAHRRRLDGGRLLATSPRLDWAKLLRRTYAVDVLVCPRCHGPTRIVAAINDPAVIRKILEHVREPPARAPPSGARDPDDHAVDEPAWLVSPRSTSKAERATMRGRGGHSPTPRRPPAEPRPRRGCGRSERPQRDPASVLVELRGCYVMSTRPLESVGDGLHFLPGCLSRALQRPLALVARSARIAGRPARSEVDLAAASAATPSLGAVAFVAKGISFIPCLAADAPLRGVRACSTPQWPPRSR